MEKYRCNICNIMIETIATDDHTSNHDHIARKRNLEKLLEELRKNKSYSNDDSLIAKWLMLAK
jgi:hypothetical protein